MFLRRVKFKRNCRTSVYVYNKRFWSVVLRSCLSFNSIDNSPNILNLSDFQVPIKIRFWWINEMTADLIKIIICSAKLGFCVGGFFLPSLQAFLLKAYAKLLRWLNQIFSQGKTYEMMKLLNSLFCRLCVYADKKLLLFSFALYKFNANKNKKDMKLIIRNHKFANELKFIYFTILIHVFQCIIAVSVITSWKKK